MNPKLSANKALTKLAISKGITHWESLVAYIKQLPYGRTSNREDLSLVFKEQQGTCSSKHALLAAIAKENALSEVQLVLVMYRMNGINTPKVERTLSQYKLSYIPEAHTVIKVVIPS